ncbi:MAG: hypothetical protein V2G41_09310 [bacterium JZ-2024 1]
MKFEVEVTVSRPDLNELLAQSLPTERQFQQALDGLVEKISERIFPSSGVGKTPGGTAYPAYRIYRLYVNRSAIPQPRGRIARRGLGRTVVFTEGWGGGADSYRGSLGLSVGREVNLTFTGATKAGLRAEALSERLGIIFFDPAVEEKASSLAQHYEFWGLSEEEISLFIDLLMRILSQ